MNIGDIVYYYEHWSDSLVKAKIENIDYCFSIAHRLR